MARSEISFCVVNVVSILYSETAFNLENRGVKFLLFYVQSPVNIKAQ